MKLVKAEKREKQSTWFR